MGTSESEPGSSAGRSTDEETSRAERAASVERQLSDTEPDGGGDTTSPAEERPVRDEEVTDEVPDSPKGVGPSGKGVEKGDEAGRHETGEDAAGRPTGTSDARDSTGVDPQDSTTGGATQPSGDQGG